MSTPPAVDTAESTDAAARRMLVVGLVALLAVLYAPVFRDLLPIWASDSYSSHGCLILLWSAWLGWSSRAAVRAAPWRLEPGALAAVAAGLALLALAQARVSLFLAALSLPVVLIGFGDFLLGRRAFRPLWFPVAFLVFMAPLPAEAIGALSLPLQGLAASFSELVLAAAHIPAVREGLVIRLASVNVHIAEGCSGLRFLLVMLVLGTGCAWAVQRRLAVRLALFALAVVSAIAANLVRVASTVVLVDVYGPAAAEGVFHGLFGKAVYLVGLGVFLLAAYAARPARASLVTKGPGQDSFRL